MAATPLSCHISRSRKGDAIVPELNRRKLLALAAMTPLAAALRPTTVSAGVTATGAAAEAREKIRRRYFPDLTLLTQENLKVRFYQDLVKDKIVLFNFFYAHCEGV
jgi:protein SCO1/2